MQRRFIPAAILLVLVMFVISEYCGEKEIIFPEISALALGAWVMEKSPWGNYWLNLWLSPSIAALIGLLIMRFFSYAPFFMIAGAFIMVIMQLKLMNSEVFPSISAAVLPIITHVHSWYYPLSVCVLTGIIALGKMLIDRFYRKEDAAGAWPVAWPSQGRECFFPEGWQHWVKVLVAVLLVSLMAVWFRWIYMIAPPLLVAFVELVKPKGTLRAKSGVVFILLGLAAFSGVFWLTAIYYFLHWPLWIYAGLAVAWLFFLFHSFSLPFPPAAAITLLPAIIPADSLWLYPWQVLLGSGILILISRLWFKGQEVCREDVGK